MQIKEVDLNLNVYLTSIRKRKQLREKAIYTFDVETNEKGFFKLVSFCKFSKSKSKTKEFSYKTFTFDNFDEFIEFLFFYKVEILYCFNIKFDSRFLANYLVNNRDVTFQPIASNSQMLGFRLNKIVNNEIVSVIMKDFFPFALTSLDEIAKIFKCSFQKYPKFEETDKLKLKQIWNDFFKNCSLDELQKHCEHDVIITAEVIYKYRLLLFKFGIDILDKKIYSLASLAMKIYRANFISEKIVNPFLEAVYNVEKKKYRYVVNQDFYDMSRLGYKGGYTANFSIEKHYDVVSFDINSSYPYQGTIIDFPCGKADITTDYDLFLSSTEKIQGFARVEVDFIDTIYFLPVLKQDIDKSWKFGRVKGLYNGVLTTIELNWLKKHNIPFEFKYGMYFSDYDRTYSVKKYCETLYKLKKEQDIWEKENNDKSPLRQIYKILLNALTGKFGQKMDLDVKINQKFITELEKYDYDLKIDWENIKTHIEKKVFEDIYYTYDIVNRKSIKSYMFPNWIALITASARIQLMDMIFKTNALYCDSDSVYLERKNICSLEDSEELGAWKIEHNCEEFRAIAPKFYAFSEFDSNQNLKKYIKLKGINYEFYPKNLYEEIMNFKEGNSIQIDNIRRFLTFKEALSRKNVKEVQGLVKYDVISKIMNPKQKI